MTHDTLLAEQVRQPHEATAIVPGVRTKSVRLGTHRCLVCGERRARFSYRGKVKADRHHTLCFECYRAELNRQRTRPSDPGSALVRMASQVPVPSRLVQDRSALLYDLQLRRRRAQIAGRHRLDAPDVVLAAAPLAS